MHILYASEGGPDAYLTAALAEAGHMVETAAEPGDGVAMAAEGGYEDILLDWRQPPVGWTARYAEAAAEALVVVVAARGDEHERVAVLHAGADACFIRPLPFAELEARLQALGRVIRRTRPAPGMGSAIQLLPAERAVRLGDGQVILSVLEFRLLEHLIQHAGEVISIPTIRRHVWGEDADPRPEPVHGCASRLRKKLDAIGAATLVQAIAGHGYVFRAEAAS